MNKEHVKFHSIGQFRNAVKDAPKQVIRFTGTVKLHGTNASIVLLPNNITYAQSRERIITPEDDNYGFAKFVQDNTDCFRSFENLSSTDEYIIYGEWCGKGIQRAVGICELEKMFVVFALKVNGKWVDEEDSISFLTRFCAMARSLGTNIHCIYDFKTYEIDIDFNYPELSINLLTKLTEAVENQCPVANALGVTGIGEGIVWSNYDHQLIFKVKGQKHSVSKVKTLVNVDVEKINSIKEFVDYAVTENRLLQAQSIIAPDLNITKLGEFIRWVFNDVVKEESDVLSTNGLDPKDVSKAVSQHARQWFQSQMEY